MSRHILVSAIPSLLLLATFSAQAQPVVVTPTTTATPASDEPVQLSAFEVQSQGDKGYNSANTVGATVVNTPIMLVPMSISVVNKEFLADVGMVDAAYAAGYFSGVAIGADPDGGQLVIRGQDLSSVQMVRDGVPDLVVESQQFSDSALFERLEIIKGPEGTIYGTFSGQGGLANYVTKEPQAVAATTMSFMYGADELGGTISRGVFDSTGSVPNHPNMLYRFVFAGQSGQSLQGGPDNSVMFSPMGTYNFKGGGSLMLRYIHYNPHRDTQAHAWFTDSAGTISTFIPANYSIPDLQTGRDYRYHKVDLRFTQPFTTGPIEWAAQGYLRYGIGWASSQYQEPAIGNFLFLNAAGQVIGNAGANTFSEPGLATIEVNPRVLALFHDFSQMSVADADLVGKFDLGPSKNNFVIYGDDLGQFSSNLDYSGSSYPGIVIWSAIPNYPGVNAHNGNEYTNAELASPVVISTNTRITSHLVGEGAQENMSFFGDKLTLVGGIRHDWQSSSTYNYFAPKSTILDDVRTGTTHKYAVVVHPEEWLTLFGNYSQTFAPNGFATDVNGNTVKLPNLASTIIEEGAKIGLFHNRIMVTGSYFKTTVADATVLITEYNAQGVAVGVNVPAGSLIIQGWEMDTTMAITDNLDLIGGAGNLDSKTATGFLARSVPFGTNYRGFLKSTFHTGPLHGIFAGFGLQHDGPRAADAADDATLPQYTVCNALLGYQYDKHWRFQVNVNNVFNTVYESISVARTIIYAGNPTDASATLTYSY